MPHRHIKKARKLSRRKNARTALLKGLLTQVLLYERVKTTQARAKEVKPLIDKAINVAKNKDAVTGLRAIKNMVANPKAAEKTVKELKDAYQNRPGGYARIINLGFRQGDGAPMVVIELVEGVRKPVEKPEAEEKMAKPSTKVKVTRKKAGQTAEKEEVKA